MRSEESQSIGMGSSEPREGEQIDYAKSAGKLTEGNSSNRIPSLSAQPKTHNFLKPRVLIVNDDDAVSKKVAAMLLGAGLASERVKGMKKGCESARSGKFQIVVTARSLADGSWKRLAYVDRHYRPGFVIILLTSGFDVNEWSQALEDGAFDVVDGAHDLQKLAESTRRALWAAYLMGAGPRPDLQSPASPASPCSV